MAEWDKRRSNLPFGQPLDFRLDGGFEFSHGGSPFYIYFLDYLF